MKVKIRRLDREFPVPAYKTAGAAAMDCYVRESTTIPARGTGIVPCSIAVKPPPGHFVLMAARSSLHKRGLLMANGIGIADEDYCGDNDEYRAPLYNFSDQPVTIERGDRILQIMVLPVDRVEWEEVESLGGPDRGGFGSTGTK